MWTLGDEAIPGRQESNPPGLHADRCTLRHAVIIELLGSLKATEVVLAIKTVEKRLSAAFKYIHCDKGSSLTPKLLEDECRDWTVIQAAPTFHSTVLVERKIRECKCYFNNIQKKFSGENKGYLPFHIYQYRYLGHIIHARGIECEKSFNELVESGQNDKNLACLKPYLVELEKHRNEIMAAAISMEPGKALYNTNEDDLYLPKTGDIVLALLGAGDTAELGVVIKGTDEAENDKPNTYPIKQNNDVSERKVMIKNQMGTKKLYPVLNLCPLSDASNPLEWKPDNDQKLSQVSGKNSSLPLPILILTFSPFSWSPQLSRLQTSACVNPFIFPLLCRSNSTPLTTCMMPLRTPG